MSVEVQQKILNPIIKDTANNIRTVSATLIPLIMLSGELRGTMEHLSTFNTMSNDTADMIDHLEINKDHKRFDVTYVLPAYITNFLMNLKRLLQIWDYSNEIDENITRSKGKVINFTPPSTEPMPFSEKHDLEMDEKDEKEYHLSDGIKSSRLIPQQVVLELLIEYLDLYRIPESDYIDKLLAEYVPKIEKVYSNTHETFNIKRNIKIFTLIVECLTKVATEYQKHYDEDDEWI